MFWQLHIASYQLLSVFFCPNAHTLPLENDVKRLIHVLGFIKKCIEGLAFLSHRPQDTKQLNGFKCIENQTDKVCRFLLIFPTEKGSCFIISPCFDMQVCYPVHRVFMDFERGLGVFFYIFKKFDGLIKIASFVPKSWLHHKRYQEPFDAFSHRVLP